jgi:exodeoxyribonuclease VII small subunit
MQDPDVAPLHPGYALAKTIAQSCDRLLDVRSDTCDRPTWPIGIAAATPLTYSRFTAIAAAREFRRPGRVVRSVGIHYIAGDSAEPVMADNTHSDVKRLPFERAIEELESIVKRLEEGKVPLEESVAIYERGEALKHRCQELLRQAEARVEKITLDAAGKPTGTEPLDVT